MAGWALTILGGALALFGLWAIVIYIWGVIDVLDEPDRSWIFWGLAIAFIGIGALVAGIFAFIAGTLLRQAPSQFRSR